ncbi:hypothetical protein [Pantoea sp. M_5]|uniref:hypothetical protein n=1 Tax=Pantoea sp. M_5 TaxID=2608038 RepID=UPI00123220A8|nr:hypothetical protein [Pantoea sp. M_5]KAA6001448.1 hypothetical protein F3I50_03640 [Pantoea sp. M_5]
MSIEWNGEGLPPVGCECEREVPGGWSRCRINYASSALIVYQMLDTGNEYASTLSAFKFRPIRTEAQRKRDDRIASLDNFINGFLKSTNGNHAHLGEAIYEWLAVLDKLKTPTSP